MRFRSWRSVLAVMRCWSAAPVSYVNGSVVRSRNDARANDARPGRRSEPTTLLHCDLPNPGSVASPAVALSALEDPLRNESRDDVVWHVDHVAYSEIHRHA